MAIEGRSKAEMGTIDTLSSTCSFLVHDTSRISGDKEVWTDAGIVDVKSWPEYTISSGAITITGKYEILAIEIDTEGDAATDDLDTITAADVGVLICKAVDSSRSVVFKDGTGNLRISGDFTCDHATDIIVMVRLSNGNFAEISRSNNA